MEKFEYKTLINADQTVGKFNINDFQNTLNELGQQGWELASTVATNDHSGARMWIFKRRLHQ